MSVGISEDEIPHDFLDLEHEAPPPSRSQPRGRGCSACLPSSEADLRERLSNRNVTTRALEARAGAVRRVAPFEAPRPPSTACSSGCQILPALDTYLAERATRWVLVRTTRTCRQVSERPARSKGPSVRGSILPRAELRGSCGVGDTDGRSCGAGPSTDHEAAKAPIACSREGGFEVG